MEDEDVDCVTKIDDVSVVDNISSCVPVCKEVDKIFSSKSVVDSPNVDETNEKNLIKLQCVANHQEIAETKSEVLSDLVDVSETSPKKVNGEVLKSDGVISEEESNSCKKITETNDVKESDENLFREVECSNKRKHVSSDTSDELNPSDEESDNKTSPCSSPVEFRGFKKRKLLESEKGKVSSECDTSFEEERNVACESVKPKVVELRRSARNANMAKKKSSEQPVEPKEENGDQLTEYAQYLGLQPTVKFKCGRCGEKHFQSMASLNTHQKICSKSGSSALLKPSKPSVDSNLSTNFRITRKVYLCSACGTYYENWKLFLHMRDMHKRHICLFCLGMFSVADKLAEHLLFKHNVHEKTCKSPEEFLSLFKGSCYLTCCSCEKMFTEREDFFDHQCKDSISASSTSSKDNLHFTSKDVTQRCNLCGILCGHFQSCPNVQNNTNKFQNALMPSTSVNNVNSSSTSNINLTKFYIPVPSSVQKEWSNKTIQTSTKPVSSADKDDYFDLGNAASFCHVDMANDSDTQMSPDKLRIEKINSECRTYSWQETHKKGLNVSTSKENVGNEVSSTNVTHIEIFSSSDESVPEKNDNNICEAKEFCDKKIRCQNGDNLKSDNEIDVPIESENKIVNRNENENENCDRNENDISENDIRNEDENDADDEQNSSEDGTTKMEKSAEELDSGVSDFETGVDDKKDDIKVKDNSFQPCYIVLNRVDEKSDDDKEKNTDLQMDGEEKLEDKERKPLDCSNDVDKIGASDISDGNSYSLANLKTNSSSSNESSNLDETNSVPSTEVKNSNDTKDDNVIDKDCMNSVENKLTNQPSSPFMQNGFESKESNDLLDKSDESEDSDKLSVVLSEDGYDDDHIENETKEDKSDVDLDHNQSELNSSLEKSNFPDESFKQVESDMSNDSHIVHNGNETVDDSDNLESQNDEGLVARKEDNFKIDGEKFQLASDEITAMALTLEDKMDSLSSQFIIKECVRTSCTTCSYCSHAIKIGVNGKQLALHLLAEHRYMPVKNETVEDVIERLKISLDELQDVWFNTDSYDSSDKSCFVSYDHTYECFQCNYVANLHKDLFSHKRKVHQKSTIYCCMCKANFHSYSELLCHMCPGVYVSKDIQFRCCLCQLDRIPSAFRLMVHLRKSHHTCDICLEVAGDQQKLSTHMWKHKLHHLCYRCGISYRNKPDITKHLFWKHGTESVLCKKCLQKKWPHVYHFCIPPTVFMCEECNLSFSKAVALKVHKRLHSGDFPHTCTICEQKFISKKLLFKHNEMHNEKTIKNNSKPDVLPFPEDLQKTTDPNISAVSDASVPLAESTNDTLPEIEKCDETPVKLHKKRSKKDREKKVKPVVDVYDLPPLNLSSDSDDSDDEKEVKFSQLNSEESQEKSEKEIVKNDDLNSDKDGGTTAEDVPTTNLAEEDCTRFKATDVNSVEPGAESEETVQPVPVLHGIWDSFHSYKAEQEKRENLDINKKPSQSDGTPPASPKDLMLADHDYCKSSIVLETAGDEIIESEKPTTREHSSSIDHDYCTQNKVEGTGSLTPSNQDKVSLDTPSKKKQKNPKKKVSKQHNSSSSSDSSSDSDSSTGSCSCGTNCSCTSSSSNSSSSSSSDSDSSSSEGRRHNTSIIKREKKKEKLKNKKKEEPVKTSEPLPPTEVEPVVDPPFDLDAEEPLIKESDLETEETSTDEEFYDQNPQRHANQLLAEKRNQLMGLSPVTTVNNGNVSPPTPYPETLPPPSLPLPVNDSQTILSTPPLSPFPVMAVSPTVVHPQIRKKVKSKKRKKSSPLVNSRTPAKPSNLLHETAQPSTSFSVNLGKQMISDYQEPSFAGIAQVSSKNSLDNMFQSNRQAQKSLLNSESHSSKRHSKRRRIRNKFYGYSSEEEDEQAQHHPPLKWKKTSNEVNAQHHIQQQQLHQLQQQQQQQQHHNQQQQLHLQQQYQAPQPPVVPDYNFPPKIVQPMRTINDHRNINTNDRLTKRDCTSGSSSSSEIDSGSDSERTPVNPVVAHASGAMATGEKDDKLYCYCQCPYDEVSEMIACDGADCAIEWFHFECVGIMVPPKGKWYCPDCRKRRGLS